MGRIYGETDKETENVNSEVKADSIKTSKKPKKSLSKRSAVILSLVLGAAIGAGSCVGYSVYATGNVLGIAAENQKSGAEYIATLKAHGVAITQDSVSILHHRISKMSSLILVIQPLMKLHLHMIILIHL